MSTTPGPERLLRGTLATPAARANRRVDALLDLVVVAVASGTVAYHLTLLLGLSRLLLAAMWFGVAAIGLVAVGRASTEPARLETVPGDPSAAAAAAALAVGAGLVLYIRQLSRWWWVFWILIAGAHAVGIWATLGNRKAARLSKRVTRVPRGIAAVLVLAAAMGIAALATTRPDLDDVYVVNRSVYVEEHRGPIPTEDTIFSDQAYSGERAPLRSPAFEVLVGIVAAAAPVKAATVAYFWVAPFAAFLSVLAIWRLLRALCCTRPLLALAAAVAFLLLDGSSHNSFGNFGFARLWQGKVVLTAVFVPLLWIFAVRWGRDGSRRHLVLLAAANIGAVGLSSTGLFIAPLATLVVSAAVAIAVRNFRRLLAAVATTAYPVMFALLNRAGDAGVRESGPSSVDPLSPWSRWTLVFGRPALGLCAMALALAWLAARDRAGRLVLAVAPLLVVVMLYGPRMLDPLRTFAPGAGAILWRTIWVIPIPALVGMALVVPWSFPARSRVVAAPIGGVIAAAACFFALTTTPVMSARNHASVGWPMWKTGGDLGVATRLVQEAGPGSLVAGPFAVDRVVPIIASDVRAVDPRPGWYATGVDPEPRRLVQRGLTHGIGETEAGAFETAVDTLDVDAVALPFRLRGDVAARVLERRGFVPVGIEGQYLVLKKARVPPPQAGREAPPAASPPERGQS